MRISVFGLGYVGSVSLGCFAKLGHKLIGVDINNKKIELVRRGKSSILEPGLDELIKSGVRKGNIRVTDDFIFAIKDTDISFVCIGTPGKTDGSLNLNHLFNSIGQIGEGLKAKNSFHTVVIRSTIPPGTHKLLVDKLENKSGKKEGKDFCLIVNPEFLREGSAVKDFFNPPVNVIGSKCKKGIGILRKIYRFNKAPVIIEDEKIAETIKFASNTYHALKIAFANELGTFFKSLGLNSNALMDVFIQDTKLNVSSAYLKPGFAFGGSCLQKDVDAVVKIAENNKLNIPLISGIKSSNSHHIKRAEELIKKLGKKKIGVWGLSFKIGTDDMRESPIIKVINNLKDKRFKIKAFDQSVDLRNLIGSNKEFVEKNFKNIGEIFVDNFNNLLNYSEVLVVNSFDPVLIKKVISKKNIIVVDLINIPELKTMKSYHGLCW